MEKASIIQTIQKVLKNTCGLEYAFGNDVPLSQRSKISNNIHEVASELNRLYKTNFQGVLLRSMTVTQIANEIISKMVPSSKSQGPKRHHLNKERHLNIVVVGRAGVGKSSFLNYAAGKKVFETGIGDPVTQSYFDVIDVEKPEKKVVYSLHDTKGLEAGNTEEWKNAIYSEIELRDESDNIYDWFHTIIYCIDASSKRIQPFEINAIKEMAEKGSVLVLLTKKDLVTPDILQNLRQQVLTEIGDKVQVLSVCNVSTRTRKGESKASGLEEVLRVSFLGLWEKASKVLPRRMIKDVVNINRILSVDNDLADLCAYASLTCCRTDGDEDEKVFVDSLDISEIVGDNYSSVIGKEKNIPFSYFKKISEISEVDVRYVGGDIQITIDDGYFPWLFLLPKQLNHDELDEWYYRGAIGTYVRLLNEIFSGLTAQMKSRVRDIKSAVGKNGEIVTEVLKFYNDVNGTKQKPLFSHKTDEAIATLEHIDYDELGKKFSQLSGTVRSSLREIANTFISSGAERREANSRYAEFRGWVTDKVSYLESCVQQFISSYEAELHTYGQYCIREDEFAGNNAEASKGQEENKGLSQLRALIKVTLSDGVILPKERMMLETMAEMQGISRSELDKLIMEVDRG